MIIQSPFVATPPEHRATAAPLQQWPAPTTIPLAPPVTFGAPGPPLTTPLGNRLLAVTALALPVVVLALAPMWQFDHWQWLSLCLAAPVVVSGALPFHRAAWVELRRGRATTNSLVSLAVLAGFGWSLLALFAGEAGTVGIRQTLRFDLWTPDSRSPLYLAVAAGLTWLALLGRWLETRNHDSGPSVLGQPRRTRSGAAWRPTDRAAALILASVLVLAPATAGFWLAASGHAGGAGAAAAAVLILACPGGLVLAAPLVVTLGQRRRRELGLRIEGTGLLTMARSVDTILLRRTGALTNGDLSLANVVTSEDTTTEQTLTLVGSLERRATSHPIARAIADAAHDHCVPVRPVELLADRSGLGVRGIVDGHDVVAGSERFLAGWAHRLPAGLATARANAAAHGHVAVLAGWDHEIRAILVLSDQPRPTVAEAIAELEDLGVRPMLLTGDCGRSATTMADTVGVDDVITNVLPEERAEMVARLKAEGRVVALLNGRWDDVSLGYADLVIDGIDSEPGDDGADLWTAVDSIRYGRTVRRLVHQNLALACAGNLAALAIAAAGRLDPTVAFGAMALSVAAVTGNSLRIRGFRSVRPPAHRPKPTR
ncbi:MAG TPA: HAD-IC family P-type ATPase [Acidimicrobiales bacterium]